MSRTAFFPEKSCSLPWNWVLQIHSFVDITKQKVFVQVNSFTAEGFSETRPCMPLSKHVFQSQ